MRIVRPFVWTQSLACKQTSQSNQAMKQLCCSRMDANLLLLLADKLDAMTRIECEW